MSSGEPKTLIDIFKKIQPGDIVLFELEHENGDIDIPQAAIIVGIDVWDMACAVYYTEYNRFHSYEHGEPEIKAFGEWMEYWRIIAHWHNDPGEAEINRIIEKRIKIKK